MRGVAQGKGEDLSRRENVTLTKKYLRSDCIMSWRHRMTHGAASGDSIPSYRGACVTAWTFSAVFWRSVSSSPGETLASLVTHMLPVRRE